MDRVSPLRILTMATVLALPACLHSNDATDPDPCYPGTFAGDASAPGTGAFTLVVGTEDSSGHRVATQWKDGDHVALVGGAQGGFMIRPAIDVTAPAPLSAGGGTVCLGVRMTATAQIDSNYASAKVSPAAGTTSTYHIGALFGLLSYSHNIDGVSVMVGIDVQVAGGGDGHARVTVVPDSTVSP